MSNRKDFTEKTKQQLKTELQQSRNIPAYLSYLYNEPDMEEVLEVCTPYIPELNGAMQKIIDKADSSLNQIDGIWSQVSIADDAGATKINNLTARVTALKDEFTYLSGLLVGGQNCPILSLSPEDLQLALRGQGGAFTDINLEQTYDLKIQDECFELLEHEPFNITEEEWRSMTYEQKKDFLEEFYDEVQNIMGITMPNPDLVFGTLENPVAAATHGQIDENGNRCIGIQTRDTDGDGDSDVGIWTWTLDFAITVIVHESRHAYQYEVVEDYKNRQKGDSDLNRHPFTSENTAYHWDTDIYARVTTPYPDKDDPEYETKLIQHYKEINANHSCTKENDARGMAKQTEASPNPEVDSGLERLNPTYPGSWEVPDWAIERNARDALLQGSRQLLY